MSNSNFRFYCGLVTLRSEVTNLCEYLLSDGTKPLPEPMLTYSESGSVALIYDRFKENYLKFQIIK